MTPFKVNFKENSQGNPKGNFKDNPAKNPQAKGFTLLEVLVALAILSTVALVALRNVGENQRQVAETIWFDEVLSAGRARMIQIIRQHPDELVQRGTLTPEFPDANWSSKVYPLKTGLGRRFEFTITEDTQTQKRTLTLEYVLP